MKNKDKIEFVEEWDLYPNDIVAKGETGIVEEVQRYMILIKLDKHHEDLSYWSNCVCISLLSDEVRKVKDYIKKIE